MGDLHSIRIRASYDPETGAITCENPGNGFDEGVLARWYPDNDRDASGESDPFDTEVTDGEAGAGGAWDAAMAFVTGFNSGV
ncbi:MAG: hypothetical protein EXR07_00315 [Acetobacteraceae bacterium]|nr:hypothetical protein [Acetobacteraceae bacterium]